MTKRSCVTCGSEYQPTNWGQRYCSDECKKTATCEECGTRFYRKTRTARFCSLACTNVPSIVTERFWRFVKKTPGCWNWLGANAMGYGQIGDHGRIKLAHRVSFELNKGELYT